MTAKSLLHSPGRAQHLEDVDFHIGTAADLSRLAWDYVNNLVSVQQESVRIDYRDLAGFCRLLDLIADHTSAAEYVLNNGADDAS